MQKTTDDLLARLVAECHGLIDASGLDGGKGGGWGAYDPLMVDMRKIVKEADLHLTNKALLLKKVVCDV